MSWKTFIKNLAITFGFSSVLLSAWVILFTNYVVDRRPPASIRKFTPIPETLTICQDPDGRIWAYMDKRWVELAPVRS